MSWVRTRAAAPAVALVALVGAVGALAFVAEREESGAPPPPTTTSTTSTTIPASTLAAAIASSLHDGLGVDLTPVQAACIATALVDAVGLDRLESLVGVAAPLTALVPTERSQLQRGAVACVPPEVAAVLLGTSTTAAPPVSLPGEGG